MNRAILRFGLMILVSLVFLKPTQAQQSSGVLLELFSSEGCQSCPYADEFMQEILKISDSTNSPVYVIDYHVDIWNRSGWYDSSSTPEFSKRQVDYMKKVKQESMFTPMLFVNGQYGAPAVNKKFVGQAIFKELVTPEAVGFTMNAAMLNNGKGLSISYNLNKKMDSLQVVLVLTKKELTRSITAGENKGKTLTHHNVAQNMQIIPIKSEPSGIVNFSIDPNLDLSDYLLVGFVQHVNSWKVLATDQVYFKR